MIILKNWFYRENRKTWKVSEWKPGMVVYVCNHTGKVEIARSSLVTWWVQGQLGLYEVLSQNKIFKIKKWLHFLNKDMAPLLSASYICREQGFESQGLIGWLTATHNSIYGWTDTFVWLPLGTNNTCDTQTYTRTEHRKVLNNFTIFSSNKKCE